MAQYTTTIFDGDPAASGPCAWPDWDQRLTVADSADEAASMALDLACEEARLGGQYARGDRLWVLVWDEDDISLVWDEDDISVAKASREIWP